MEPLKLIINKSTLPFKNEYKYLGIIFQTNGSYTSHLKHITKKCHRRLNLLRMIKGTTWGTAKPCMLSLYKTLIRSILDYGMEAYCSSTVTAKEVVQKIQNECLRLCTGAMKSTPLVCLQHTCNEMPIDIQYRSLCLSYKAHVLTFQKHPAEEIIKDSWLENFPEPYIQNFATFNMVTKQFFAGTINVNALQIISAPPWTLSSPKFDSKFTNINKNDMLNLSLQQEFREHINVNYFNYVLVFTDGSKTEWGTASAFVVPSCSVKCSYKLNKFSSVFTSELYAILVSLRWISKQKIGKYLIISDSLNCLKVLSNKKNWIYNYLVSEIVVLLSDMAKNGTIINFLWIPSHSGIYGNEKVDSLARMMTAKDPPTTLDTQSINSETVELPLNLFEIKKIIKQKCRKEWNEDYLNSVTGRTYKQIFPNIDVLSVTVNPTIFRLQTGHCRLNKHLHKIGIHPTGLCSICKSPESVKHFLLICPLYEKPRKQLESALTKMNLPLTLESLFSESSQQALIIFIKSTHRFI